MGSMKIVRDCQPFTRALHTNYASNSYPVLVPTITPPAPGSPSPNGGNANGVFAPSGLPAPVSGGTNAAPALITELSLLGCFFGTGADDATFLAQLIGWKQTIGIAATSLWIPVPLLEVTCTLSTIEGVAGADVIATERFADTLVLTSGYSTTYGGGTQVTSPTGNVIAWLVSSLNGFGAFQWIFNCNSSATGANCLFALY